MIYQILTLLVSRGGRWKPPLYFPHPSPSFSQFLIFTLLFSSCCCFLIAFGILNVLKSLVLIPHTLGFPGSSAGKESSCNAGDPSSIPGLGSSPGEQIGCPLQYSWASLVAQLVKSSPPMWETWVYPWVGKIPWRRERLPTAVFWPGEFHGLYIVHVTKSQTQLSDFHFHIL